MHFLTIGKESSTATDWIFYLAESNGVHILVNLIYVCVYDMCSYFIRITILLVKHNGKLAKCL